MPTQETEKTALCKDAAKPTRKGNNGRYILTKSKYCNDKIGNKREDRFCFQLEKPKS